MQRYWQTNLNKENSASTSNGYLAHICDNLYITNKFPIVNTMDVTLDRSHSVFYFVPHSQAGSTMLHRIELRKQQKHGVHFLRLLLQHPKYPEREPGRSHLSSEPHAAVALHNRAETGHRIFQQLGDQLERLWPPSSCQTKPHPRPSGCHRNRELVTLAASSLQFKSFNLNFNFEFNLLIRIKRTSCHTVANKALACTFLGKEYYLFQRAH